MFHVEKHRHARKTLGNIDLLPCLAFHSHYWVTGYADGKGKLGCFRKQGSRWKCPLSRPRLNWMCKADKVVRILEKGKEPTQKTENITETITSLQVPMVWFRKIKTSSWTMGSMVVVFLFAIARLLLRSGKNPSMKTETKTFQSVLSPKKTQVNANDTSSDKLQFRAVPSPAVTSDEALDLLGDDSKKFIIVGGKGGVGKTSLSSALATRLADAGKKTLIISTDPAHSLSDVFEQNLSNGETVAIIGTDNLYAMEVNPNDLKDTFKLLPASQRNELLGMGDMGLDDLDNLFETLPPGFDEAVALVEIIRLIQGDPQYIKYQKIIFDTAPTGHTLRLLSLPDFLDGFVGKFLSMKNKFSNVMNSFKGMFGSQDQANLDTRDLEDLKKSMKIVRELFRDQQQTEFIVATIPNMMAIAESLRLVQELRKEKIPVRHLFVNQIQVENNHCTFCSARYKEHKANLQYIREQFQGLRITPVQCFDREIRGLYALRTMAEQIFPDKKKKQDTSHWSLEKDTTNGSSKVETSLDTTAHHTSQVSRENVSVDANVSSHSD
eukprot:jgi/Galph1/3155/GphlegSOOS_G1809.1